MCLACEFQQDFHFEEYFQSITHFGEYYLRKHGILTRFCWTVTIKTQNMQEKFDLVPTYNGMGKSYWSCKAYSSFGKHKQRGRR
jgi:hypothetical protein